MLVDAWLAQEIGDRHAYQWAMHTPLAADGGEQPHVHIMWSERQLDGIERDRAQYFRRWNRKAPEKGGARKGWGAHAGESLTPKQRKADLVALRERWEKLVNAHLARAGSVARINMRSHAARGLEYPPERKQLPSAWRGEGRANVLRWRRAKTELQAAQKELVRQMPDMEMLLRMEEQRHDRDEGQGADVPEAKPSPKKPKGPSPWM